MDKVYGKQPGDANVYINRQIKDYDIVLYYIPGIGISNTANIASSLQVSYKKVRFVLIVGICSRAFYLSSNQNIFLGNIIVNDSVIEYNFGRQYSGDFQRKTDIKDILEYSD